MTLSELMGMIGALIGAIVLSYLGHSFLGWVGAILGVVAGLVVGCIAGYGFIELLDRAGISLWGCTERHGLRKHFGRFWTPREAECWNYIKDQISIGDKVTGKVVAKYRYGVFLDIGRGFPALLTKLYSDEATRSSEPGLGEQVNAQLREFDDKNRYLELTQLKDEKKERGERQ